MESRSGYFMVIDGPRGAGKTTLIESLSHDWETGMGGVFREFDSMVCTREIGGCETSERIRKLFTHAQNPTGASMDVGTELLLINAARREHLIKTIGPALSEPKSLVVCDRWVSSTYAFQHAWKGVPYPYVFDLHHDYCWNTFPDLTIILDVPPEECIKRTADREFPLSNDEESIKSYHKIYEGFMEYVVAANEDTSWAKESGEVHKVNGVFASGTVKRRVRHIMGEHYERWIKKEQ